MTFRAYDPCLGCATHSLPGHHPHHFRPWLAALLVTVTLSAVAAESETVAPARRKVLSIADAAWDAYDRIVLARNDLPEWSAPDQSGPWLSINYVARFAAARAIWEKYPDDSRKWKAAYELVYWGNWLHERGIPTAEEMALAKTLQQQLLTEPGVPDELREQSAVMAFQGEWNEHYSERANSTSDLKEAQAKLTALAERYPQAKGMDYLVYEYHMRLEKLHPEAVEDWAREQQKSPSPALADYAKGVYQHYESKRNPVEMKFTAIDGREVDLGKLHGKVVLIDFWGTWCGPCVEELPKLRSLFEKYHDQGLEIVGVIADKARREQILVFLEKNRITWPQFYDGRMDDNEFCAKFAVKSYPTVLLLNKEGLLVTDHARGEKLEPMIREKLGMPPL